MVADDEVRRRGELVSLLSRLAGFPVSDARSAEVAGLVTPNVRALRTAMQDVSAETDPEFFRRVLWGARE